MTVYAAYSPRIHEEIAMNKPYINVEAILDMFKEDLAEGPRPDKRS